MSTPLTPNPYAAEDTATRLHQLNPVALTETARFLFGTTGLSHIDAQTPATLCKALSGPLCTRSVCRKCMAYHHMSGSVHGHLTPPHRGAAQKEIEYEYAEIEYEYEYARKHNQVSRTHTKSWTTSADMRGTGGSIHGGEVRDRSAGSLDLAVLAGALVVMHLGQGARQVGRQRPRLLGARSRLPPGACLRLLRGRAGDAGFRALRGLCGGIRPLYWLLRCQAPP